MSLESFFGGVKFLGDRCVASFPVGGKEAMEFLHMLGVWKDARPAFIKCRQRKGIGIVAGCSDFTEPPQLTAFYFIQIDHTGDRLMAYGVILIPKSSTHELCADEALALMVAQAAAEANQKGLKLIS